MRIAPVERGWGNLRVIPGQSGSVRAWISEVFPQPNYPGKYARRGRSGSSTDRADERIALDLDDGVKVNYGKFGDLLAEVKAVHGKKAD